MDSSKAAAPRKRKASAPSAWPRVYKAAAGSKHEPPRASLSGRLTERQQLALALEESRKDSLPQRVEPIRVPSPEPSESGEQSSSLRCCEDDATTHQSSTRRLPKQQQQQQQQQHGRRDSCQPCSPCRTHSHEQASTSGRAGAVASSAAKTGGTFLSSSLSSGTSKQSASTAFKVPFSGTRSTALGSSNARCPPPLSLPAADSELCTSGPPSPVSHADMHAANISSSSVSDLTAGGGLQALEGMTTQQQDLATGAGAAESTGPSSDKQHLCAPSERLGSLTPSVSQSNSPSSYSQALRPCKKLRTEVPGVSSKMEDGDFPLPAARPVASGIKIKVRLGPAGAQQGKPAVVSLKVQQPSATVVAAKRTSQQMPAVAGGQAKRAKLEPINTGPPAIPQRTNNFRKPRSKTGKGKLGAGSRQPLARPSIPASVFEEPEVDHSPHPQPQVEPAVSCLLKACSQLADLDRRTVDTAATLLPRSSAFLDLKEDQGEESDGEGEDCADTDGQPAPVPPLASIEDGTCNIHLAAELTRLRLADLQATSAAQQDLQGQAKVQLLELPGKLGKAHKASELSRAIHAAAQPSVAESCAFLYRPLKAAAAAWNFGEAAFILPSVAASFKDAHGPATTASGLTASHSAEVLAALASWMQTQSDRL